MIATYIGDDGVTYHVPCAEAAGGVLQMLNGAPLPAGARVLTTIELLRYLKPRPAAGRRVRDRSGFRTA